MLVHSSGQGVCMNMVLALNNPMRKQWSGIRKLRSRDMLMHSTI